MSSPRCKSHLARSGFLVCALLLVACCASPARGAQAPQTGRAPKRVRQLINTLEEQWRAATLNGDALAMDKLLSEDYVGISWTGQINTKQMQLDRIRNHAVEVHRLDLSDMKVKIVGAVAIVTCRAAVDGNSNGHAIDGEFRYTRVYQRLPAGTWKITNFESTRIPHGRRAPQPLDETSPPSPAPPALP